MLKRIEVAPVGRWWVTYCHADAIIRVQERQSDAIRYAKSLAVDGGSVRIHNRKGRFREERTYPRSKDPKRSKG